MDKGGWAAGVCDGGTRPCVHGIWCHINEAFYLWINRLLRCMELAGQLCFAAECPCNRACFPGAGSPIMAVRGCAAASTKDGDAGPAQLPPAPCASPASRTAFPAPSIPPGPSQPPGLAHPCRAPPGLEIVFGFAWAECFHFPARPTRSAGRHSVCAAYVHHAPKWKGVKKVEGGRIAAVPSFVLEQTFLQKCVDCAFSKLDEKISLLGKVCGLSSGNGLLPTAA